MKEEDKLNPGLENLKLFFVTTTNGKTICLAKSSQCDSLFVLERLWHKNVPVVITNFNAIRYLSNVREKSVPIQKFLVKLLKTYQRTAAVLIHKICL